MNLGSKNIGYTIVLTLFAAFLLLTQINSPLFFDDLVAVNAIHTGTGLINWHPFELRALPYAIYTWTHHLFASDLFIPISRLINFVIHLSLCFVLLAFLRLLYQSVLPPTAFELTKSQHLVFWATLLFAFNPIAMYALGYLSQRSIMMATLFAVAAMYGYGRGSLHNHKGWLWSALPFYYLAVFSKEHVIMLPMALIALTALLHQDWRIKLKQRWLLFTCLFSFMFVVTFFKQSLLGTTYEDNMRYSIGAIATELLHPLSIANQAKLFFEYIGLWVIPDTSRMAIDIAKPFPTQWSWHHTLFILLFVGWGIISTALTLKRGRVGLFGFALFFPWIMFFTEFSSVRAQEIFVLYRSYLWMVCIGCILPLLTLTAARKTVLALGGLFGFVFFAISAERINSMSHPVLAWDDVIQKLPEDADKFHVFRAYANRGGGFISLKQYQRAISDFEKARSIVPSEPAAYSYLGATYVMLGEWKTANDFFTTAIQLNQKFPPMDFSLYARRSQTYAQMGQAELAKQDMTIFCAQLPLNCPNK